MRIFQAIDSYPPPLMGGHSLHVRMLGQELVKRGHDVEVVSLAGPGGARTEMDGDVVVHRIPGWSRALRPFSAVPERTLHPTVRDPGLVHSLVALIRQRQPDVVHAHGWILHSLLPFLPSRETRLVVTMHEYGLVCPKNSFVYRDGVCDGPRFAKCVACSSGQYGAIRAAALTTGMTITRHSLRRVDRYIAVSTPVARACASLSEDGQRPFELIPPFVPDATFELDDAARPSFVPPEGDYLMFAGALSPHKGIDVLLEAWRGLDSAIPLVLVGLPSHDTPRRFPEGVIVVENVPHSDVLRAWKHCTIAVVPSRWPEPVGTVAIEAMAAGRPVIASAVGGLPDIVRDGITGLLVAPNDVAALRASIVQLIAEPGLRAQMGQAGRERAASFSANVVVPQIERVYREVVANSPLPGIGGEWS
jgi:glycosyltransferase involved in cell wall biosynthesis